MTLAHQLKEEGREEGWQLASRQAVLRVLERRFGLVPAPIRAQVQSHTVHQQLDDALDLAMSVSTLAAFKL